MSETSSESPPYLTSKPTVERSLQLQLKLKLKPKLILPHPSLCLIPNNVMSSDGSAPFANFATSATTFWVNPSGERPACPRQTEAENSVGHFR